MFFWFRKWGRTIYQNSNPNAHLFSSTSQCHGVKLSQCPLGLVPQVVLDHFVLVIRQYNRDSMTTLVDLSEAQPTEHRFLPKSWILECGFCKKSFIMNDFLRNPHFSDYHQFFKLNFYWPTAKKGSGRSFLANQLSTAIWSYKHHPYKHQY